MHTVHFGEYIIYTTNEIDRVNLVSQIIGRKCSHYESYPDEDAIGLPFSTVGLPLSKPRDDEARAALFFQILTGAAAVAVPLYVMNGVMAETLSLLFLLFLLVPPRSLGHHAVHNVQRKCHRCRPHKGLEP